MVPSLARFLPILAAGILFACRGELAGPDAVKVIDRVEASFASTGMLRFDWLLHRMGWAPGGVQVADFGRDQVVVRGSPKGSRYRAYVVERMLMPNRDLGAVETCVRSGLVRRGVILFRDGDQAGSIELYGSEFDQPLTPYLRWCANDTLRVLDPRPVLFYVPNPNDGSPAWWWGTGRASISEGATGGPCPFLRDEHARFLREQRGVSCLVTRHEVSFEATVQRPDGGTFTLSLAPTEVAGIRYTIHCDGAQDQSGKLCPGLDNHVN